MLGFKCFSVPQISNCDNSEKFRTNISVEKEQLRTRRYRPGTAASLPSVRWVVVEIMVPFWVLTRIRNLKFRGPNKGTIILTTTQMSHGQNSLFKETMQALYSLRKTIFTVPQIHETQKGDHNFDNHPDEPWSKLLVQGGHAGSI